MMRRPTMADLIKMIETTPQTGGMPYEDKRLAPPINPNFNVNDAIDSEPFRLPTNPINPDELIKLMRSMPSMPNQTSFNNGNNTMPSFGLLADLNPKMMDDKTLFSQNFDELSDEDIRAIEQEQQMRNERLIQEKIRKQNEAMDLYRLKQEREKMF